GIGSADRPASAEVPARNLRRFKRVIVRPPIAPSLRRFHRAVQYGWRRRNGRGRLDGRVAIVTGGARGIGRHYSRALAAEGARVMIADLEDGCPLGDEIAAKLGANSVACATLDVSDETQVQRVVAQTIERFGQIDVLVNNAALYA